MVTNEFGEEINKEFIEYAAKKLRKLSKKEIDEFWAEVGWKEEGCAPNKTLPIGD